MCIGIPKPERYDKVHSERGGVEIVCYWQLRHRPRW